MMTSRKIEHVFLDLDSTLIASDSFYPHLMQDLYKYDNYNFIKVNSKLCYYTIARPYLEDFLKFLFSNFKVSIWTAASEPYATYVYSNFIKKNFDRNLELFLFDKHCAISQEQTNCPKKLELLWTQWGLTQFNSDNTIIIDDLIDVYNCQKKNTIKVKPFVMSKNGTKDTELLKVMHILNANK